MGDAREQFWSGLETQLTFNADGIPVVRAAAVPGTGIRYSWQHDYLASRYRRGSVVEVNIGEADQAYGIVHGEVLLEASGLPTHLLISWLHWDDKEPVYQSDYALDDDEVMPSDELEIIPCTMLSGAACLPGALPDNSDDTSDATDMGGIHWKRTHVYISETASVMPVQEAILLEPLTRSPSPESRANAQERFRRIQRERGIRLSSPTTPTKRPRYDDNNSSSWRPTQRIQLPSIRDWPINYNPLPSPPATSDGH